MRKTFDKKQIIYLNINNEEISKKIFNVSQRFDWYLIKNVIPYQQTLINDELLKNSLINLREWIFIPNYNFANIKKCLAKKGEKKCSVVYNTAYHTQQKRDISKKKSNSFRYPCVHTMTQEGLGFVYSKNDDKGHFRVPKVILSFGRYQYPYNDFKGDYCMTQIAYGILIKNKKEGDMIINAINSIKFKEIVKATKWSTFITDWRMFKYFKEDFWKEFV